MTLCRIPKDNIGRTAWEVALKNQECSSSVYVCLEHFAPDDYTVSKDGKRFDLKPGVVPTVFEVSLIEVEEKEESDDENNSNDSKLYNDHHLSTTLSSGSIDLFHTDCADCISLESQNAELREENEQLRNRIKNQEIIMSSRITHARKKELAQISEIKSLKKEIQHLKASIEQLKEQSKLRSELSVNILFNYFL